MATLIEQVKNTLVDLDSRESNLLKQIGVLQDEVDQVGKQRDALEKAASVITPELEATVNLLKSLNIFKIS